MTEAAQEQQRFFHSRRRYILLNVVLWLIIFGVSVEGLQVLRRFGDSLSEYRQARKLVAQAHQEFGNNSWRQSQVLAIEGLQLRPALADDIVAHFNTNLLALPDLTQQLEKRFSAFEEGEAPSGAAALAVGKTGLLLNDNERAKQYLAEAGKDRKSAQEAYLLLARLYLREGDLEAAQANFEQYWALSGTARSSAARRLQRLASFSDDARDNLARTSRAYYDAGLWREMRQLLDSDDTPRRHDPQLRFFDGIALELKRNYADAAQVYRQVLEEEPKHVDALERLAFLLDMPDEGRFMSR
jgi:tetratricopeptide (TPR) repeat protein